MNIRFLKMHMILRFKIFGSHMLYETAQAWYREAEAKGEAKKEELKVKPKYCFTRWKRNMDRWKRMCENMLTA